VLTDLFETFPQITKAVEPASRICELLERPSLIEKDPKVPVSGCEDKVVHGSIVFDKVCFSYPSRLDSRVLQGLSFDVKSGEVVALVGATGSGKSTVMALLMRFYKPNDGRILLDGNALESYDVHWLRRQIGIVAQEPLLFGTTIRENLMYGVTGQRIDDEGLLADCKRANVQEFIEQLPEGLSTEVGERGVQLSGGQKQRIAIARALLKRPHLLLLDEATSALDLESEKVVQHALDEVMRASMCTTIVIAHRLQTIQSVQRIIVLGDGVKQEEGSPRSLADTSNGLYARLMKIQDSSAPMPLELQNGANGDQDSDGDYKPSSAYSDRLKAQITRLETEWAKFGSAPATTPIGDIIGELKATAAELDSADLKEKRPSKSGSPYTSVLSPIGTLKPPPLKISPTNKCNGI
jgi:ATP-binding cassette subfamily B (MDR/TAP) protein 1